MRKAYLLIALIALICVECGSERKHPQKYKGYPRKNANIRSEFVNPPPGYGNVPFYWWNGDTLKIERLKEQLNILSESATEGFSVSYLHTSPRIDSAFNSQGYGLYGRTEPGEPHIFSEKWWAIWNQFAEICADKGLAAGLDDYTVGWTGNGYYPDKLMSDESFSKYRGELVFDKKTIRKGEQLSLRIEDVNNLVAIVTFPEMINLKENVINDLFTWRAPSDKDYDVYIISTKENYLLHPEHGKTLVNVYFDEFEQRMSEKGKEGMNYFFQDELLYDSKIGTWSEDFQEEFKKRKNYDITPYLPFLVEFDENITPKIRLDYCEVVMDLSEERYFKPVYDWHAERGLIYGCDNLGRGLEPMGYTDYFRATSWFTAPGNDAPARGSSFIQTKVSSSVAHLYDRPRTWLEAFHSMGWGSSGEWLTKQIDHHMIAGGNLVCMHGLYYTTHGGWWEWAPPCFHFRMPYWAHMKTWLKYTERMSYILSQGDHVCDIAMVYPTELVQAYNNLKEGSPEFVWSFAQEMSNNGLDYDFVDFRSLREAKIENEDLLITNENYKIVILPDMEAIQFSSLQKVQDFYKQGGIVLATGRLPRYSNAENNGKVNEIVKDIFGLTAEELAEGKEAVKQINEGGGIGWYIAKDMHKIIPELITPDFKSNGNGGKVLHRKVGEKDVYFVTDVEQGLECFFRAKGKVELWNAFDGSMADYAVARQTEEGTSLIMNKEKGNSYLLVFSPGNPIMENNVYAEANSSVSKIIDLTKDWEIELLPTMDNKWGDYRLPAFNGYIGAEARSFRYCPADLSPSGWMNKDFDDSSWSEELYGYGKQMETKNQSDKDWDPYSFSWQYGVWDNPGSQGYHGLKGKVSDGFMILDKGGTQAFKTSVYVPKLGVYTIGIEGVEPDKIIIDNKRVAEEYIQLNEGWHSLEIVYNNTEKNDASRHGAHYQDTRKRSAVVFYLQGTEIPVVTSYSDVPSMKWNLINSLKYDPDGGKYDVWNYRFNAVPGLEKMEIKTFGELNGIWVDGEKLDINKIVLSGKEGHVATYHVALPEKKERVATIAFTLKVPMGYQGTLALADVVKLTTNKGIMDAGDWSEVGALKYYSGGMYYRKNISVTEDMLSKEIMLNLGRVIATCEIKVNGKPLGVLINSPYEMDITKALKRGSNTIEVLVYSTLSNHYQSIPSPYKGEPEAGMIGPVNLLIYSSR